MNNHWDDMSIELGRAFNKPNTKTHKTGYYGTDGAEIINGDYHKHTAPLAVALRRCGDRGITAIVGKIDRRNHKRRNQS